MTTTSPRVPRRDAQENRAALLDAARNVFNRNPNASLEAVAIEAGLSRRSVYGHFATRDELILELVTAGSKRIADALEGLSHPHPLTHLSLIASRLWLEVESVQVMAFVAVRGPLATHTASALGSVRDNLRRAIAAGCADGSMRTDVPVDRLARLVEGSALLVLEESVEHPITARDGHQLVMLMTLAAVGLSWTQASTFIAATPELAWTDSE